jgi:hypothetical protein
MKKCIATVLSIFGFLILAFAAHAQDATVVAESLRHNVVTIKANWENKEIHNGFGWIVGVDNNKVYIVTANHVVRGRGPTAIDRSPAITLFFQKTIISEGVRLLPQSDRNLDLAVIEMPLPTNLLLKLAVDDIAFTSSMNMLSYIGAGNKWRVPKSASGVLTESAQKQTLFVTGLDVDVGTSGAPLIGNKGILGMFISNEAIRIDGKLQNRAKVLSVRAIQEKLAQWQYPWSLTAYAPSSIVSGDWHYLYPGDEPIKASILASKETPHHFTFTAQLASGDQVAAGNAVIDGEVFKVVYESVLVPSVVKADLAVKVKQSSTNGNEALLLEGIVSFVDEFDEPTTEYMRLVKLNSDERYAAKAVAYMKANPNPELDSMLEGQAIADEITKKHKNDVPNVQTTALQSTRKNPSNFAKNPQVAGMMVAQMQQLINMSGIDTVKLNVSDSCIVASGVVEDAATKKKISSLLQAVSSQSGMNACNELTLAK